MNTISVERRQNDLIRSILGIKDIDTLKSLQASVSRAKKKAAAKCEDDTCMTKEEFFDELKVVLKEMYESGEL